jgi:hypothetical protein
MTKIYVCSFKYEIGYKKNWTTKFLIFIVQLGLHNGWTGSPSTCTPCLCNLYDHIIVELVNNRFCFHPLNVCMKTWCLSEHVTCYGTKFEYTLFPKCTESTVCLCCTLYIYNILLCLLCLWNWPPLLKYSSLECCVTFFKDNKQPTKLHPCKWTQKANPERQVLKITVWRVGVTFQ